MVDSCWRSLIIIYGRSWWIYLQLSSAFRDFLKFWIFIAQVHLPMRPYQALTNNSPNKGQLQDIKNFHFLSSPPKKGWLAPLSSFSPGLLLSGFLPTYLPPEEFWRRVTDTPLPQRHGIVLLPPLSRQQLVGRATSMLNVKCSHCWLLFMDNHCWLLFMDDHCWLLLMDDQCWLLLMTQPGL